jgi:hypothetical protein
MSTKYTLKRRQKLLDGRCLLCGEADPAVLNGHCIVPGEDGGRYSSRNVVTLCANCHRKTHDGQIVIDRFYLSTGGYLLHCWVGGEA